MGIQIRAYTRDINNTCRKRSSTILWESGSKSAGEPNPRSALVSADLAPNIRRHHSRGDRIQMYKVNGGIQISGGSKSALKADSQCQKRSDQRPATCCATRARDSCRFTMYTTWRPAALRDHGTYTMRREENRLQLKGSEFLLVNCGF